MASTDYLDLMDELIRSFLQGNITPSEFAELKKWMSLNSDNKAYFKKMYLIWKAEAIAGQDQENLETAFQKVYRKIFEDEKLSSAVPSGNPFIRSIFKWAAVIVISIGSGVLLNHFVLENRQGKTVASFNEINVPLGSKSRIVLPDSSEVWLNAGSRLTYSTTFGKEYRIVNLTGEGYFKVSKDPGKPFIVHTSRANIRAIGTEFNVKAYPEENGVETILVEGSVVVNNITLPDNDKNKRVVLKPGQKILLFSSVDSSTNEDFSRDKTESFAENKVPKAPVEMSLEVTNPEVETSWKDQSWVIQGEDIKDLCVELGRRFNISVVHLDERLKKYKFSGTIQKETLEQVFDLMKLTIPMSYTIDKGKVSITLNSNLENKYKRAYNNYEN